jgi:hypothetical protein
MSTDGIEALIEASSFGTPGAKALRARTPPEIRERVMTRVRELSRPQERLAMAVELDESGYSDEYTYQPAHASEPPFDRVYLAGDQLAHLMRPEDQWIICEPWLEEIGEDGEIADLAEGPLNSLPRNAWLGTGTQDEYEFAALLPLCLTCFAIREYRLPDESLGADHGREMT